MKRRCFLSRTGVVAIAGLPWLPGCGGGGGSNGGGDTAPVPVPDPTTTHVGSITVDPTAAGTAVNRRILGSNVEWVDRGDNLLTAAGAIDANMLGLVKAMGPTVLRYPGGTQSDAFHWNQASNEHVFTGAVQPTLMNTQRLLELCEATGAEPLFTVNLVTGTADEAAAWVRATNVTRFTSTATRNLLPKVTFWELGNEPYLKADVASDLNLDLAPAEFARRANLFIAAMRAVDPSIQIGLPLTLDTRNGVPITAYPDFSRTVLAALTQRFDFVSLHNAYLPLVFGGAIDVTALYPGAMAAAESVRDDFAATRALLKTLRPSETYPLAVTEHAPLFSLGENTSTIATDDWMTTPLGAIYLADLIRVFAETGDLLLANHWSLSGNGRFGAIGGATGAGFNRAAADVLTLAGSALRGNRLTPAIVCDSTSTRSVGLVSARSGLPLMSALATRDGSTLRLLLIHKDATRNAQFAVNLRGATGTAAATTARLTTLAAADVTAVSDVAGLWQRSSTAPAVGASLTVTMPPHSVALLEMTI